MLGRLEMTVDQCIEAYTGMMDVIFDPKDKKKLPFKLSNGKVQPKYKTKHMEQAIKQVIIHAGSNSDDLFRGSKNSTCKTYVNRPNRASVKSLTSIQNRHRPHWGRPHANTIHRLC
jgi:hypothetical protein